MGEQEKLQKQQLEFDFDYVFAIALLQHIPGKDLQVLAMKQLKNKN